MMDRARIETFLARFVELASGATTIGLLSVADRSGLTEHLARLEEATAGEVASAAGLEERYVIEILSGLAAAEVVEYDPETTRFRLPPEHSLFLADESSPYFMGGFVDMITLMLSQLERVTTATREGGGVGYEELGAELATAVDRANSPSYRAFLTRRWLPGVPGLVDRLQSGIRVADVGCGTGTAATLMAEAYPRSQVHGYDLSEEAIAVARERAKGMNNVSFEILPIAEIPTEPRFGLITAFDVIHDLAEPVESLLRIREALGEAGLLLMMEPNLSSHLEDNLHRRGALFYGISTLHCMTQSLARGGPGLGAAWGRHRAAELADAAGFSSFEHLEEISNRFSAFYLLTP